MYDLDTMAIKRRNKSRVDNYRHLMIENIKFSKFMSFTNNLRHKILKQVQTKQNESTSEFHLPIIFVTRSWNKLEQKQNNWVHEWVSFTNNHLCHKILKWVRAKTNQSSPRGSLLIKTIELEQVRTKQNNWVHKWVY